LKKKIFTHSSDFLIKQFFDSFFENSVWLKISLYLFIKSGKDLRDFRWLARNFSYVERFYGLANSWKKFFKQNHKKVKKYFQWAICLIRFQQIPFSKWRSFAKIQMKIFKSIFHMFMEIFFANTHLGTFKTGNTLFRVKYFKEN